METNNIQSMKVLKADWFWMKNDSFDFISDKLGPVSVAVYAWLCYYANKSISSWSLNDLSQRTGISKEIIKRILADLENIGVISVGTGDEEGIISIL